ncbi:hypothetical protein NKR23_g4649 [Pleurostoma richardsiae]|uniref:Uncharacterized protein n=1 Tax=Pleurostoma richardsiae TaxID=41990 RepID=A0AA38RV99_9PEZI|nr:hypothetical protein NKR23_g4649 [Pleurostoma richardsiae]
MATPHQRPDFGPIPQEHGFRPTNIVPPRRNYQEGFRPARTDLGFLDFTTFNTYSPYAWGYTIYRAVFGGTSDARFAEGLRRLEAWVRWHVRMQRYEEIRDWPEECKPASDEVDGPTDELAKRMWNEVFEDYPDTEQVITEPEGREDFSPVGRAFISWVASLGVDTSGLNTRYDLCLVIDETVLKMLEKLPAQTPPVGPLQKGSPEESRLFDLMINTWVWILDRKTMEEKENGIAREFLPWARLRMGFFYDLWFKRPRGLDPANWKCLVEEDRARPDTVRW